MAGHGEAALAHVVQAHGTCLLTGPHGPARRGARSAPLVFPLHHVHSLVLEQRANEYWLDGVPAKIRAALVLPAAVADIDDPDALGTIQSLFGDRTGVNFQGTVTLAQLTLTEMTWLDPAVGVVPGACAARS